MPEKLAFPEKILLPIKYVFVVPPALVPRRTSPKDWKFPLKTVLTTPTLKVSFTIIGSLKVAEELNVAPHQI